MPSGTDRRSGRSSKKAATTSAPEQVAFKRLPGLNRVAAGRPLKVCVVTSEILGPVKNGGIGTATSALVDNLADNGHEVTILYTLVQHDEPACAEKTWEHWVKELADRGITLTHIPHLGVYRDWLQKSWLVKQHLASRDYDVVYFNEHHGSAYYTLAAKRVGLLPFANRIHCVVTHGAIEWVYNTNDQRLKRATDLQIIGLERRSVEWADAVIGPSSYLLRQYKSYGWALPAHTYCQPYPFPIGETLQVRERSPVHELVFFGRLETRKGVWLFCEALNRMGDALRNCKVTFLGRPNDVSDFPRSPVFILPRAEKWPCEVNLLLDYNQEQALDYLSKPGRVAVMPALADNSPCVVYECMQQQIPFIATTGSGADELIHPDCWPSVMCAPNAVSLSERMLEVLAKGASTAWPRFEAKQNLAEWKAWSQLLGDTRARTALFEDMAPAAPARKSKLASRTTVFLFIDDRSVGLGEMLDRLQSQMERLGKNGSFAFLSARKEPLQTLIDGALQAYAAQVDCAFTFVSPSDLRSFLASLRDDKATLFVTDLCNEFVEAFVLQARELVATGAAVAISCAAASRSSEKEQPAITELPAGDLPGAGGLGMQFTSSAWAVAAAQAGQCLGATEFTDASYGELTAAKDVGQLLFHRLSTAGLPVRLIPEVGTIRTSASQRAAHERHWFQSAVLHADALGMKPYLFKDAPGWLAASSFGFRSVNPPARPALVELLPKEHPLHHTPHTRGGVAELARFAAALGRTDLAVQIAAASDIKVEVDDLLNTAVHAARSRPLIDLRALVAGEARLDSATEAMKSLRASMANLAVERTRDNLLVQFRNAKEEAGSATFFDVALTGHETYTLSVRALPGRACDIGTTIIDQATGNVLGEASLSLDTGEEQVMEITLSGIYGLFCVIVEFSTSSRGSPAVLLSRMQIT